MVYEFGVRWIAMRAPGISWMPSSPRASVLSRRETPETVVYTLNVPGYRRKDLTVEVRNRVVTIRGERSPRWFQQSSATASFSESFSLSEALDEQDIDAKLRAGVLSLTVGKKPHARARRIPVQVAHGSGALTTQTGDAQEASSRSLWKRLRDWWHAHAPSAAQ